MPGVADATTTDAALAVWANTRVVGEAVVRRWLDRAGWVCSSGSSHRLTRVPVSRRASSFSTHFGTVAWPKTTSSLVDHRRQAWSVQQEETQRGSSCLGRTAMFEDQYADRQRRLTPSRFRRGTRACRRCSAAVRPCPARTGGRLREVVTLHDVAGICFSTSALCRARSAGRRRAPGSRLGRSRGLN